MRDRAELNFWHGLILFQLYLQRKALHRIFNPPPQIYGLRNGFKSVLSSTVLILYEIHDNYCLTDLKINLGLLLQLMWSRPELIYFQQSETSLWRKDKNQHHSGKAHTVLIEHNVCAVGCSFPFHQILKRLLRYYSNAWITFSSWEDMKYQFTTIICSD